MLLIHSETFRDMFQIQGFLIQVLDFGEREGMGLGVRPMFSGAETVVFDGTTPV